MAILDCGGKGKHAARKPMVYHQSIAWAVNHGMECLVPVSSAIASLLWVSSAVVPRAGGDFNIENALHRL